MNTLERFFYNRLIAQPRLKKIVSTAYQLLFLLLSKKTESYALVKPIELKGYFFGFHDKVPWDVSDSFLLAHQLNPELERDAGSQPISVGLFSSDYKFTVLATTNAWNWQQGSMLQWVGRTQFVAFNDFISGELTRLFDIHGNEISRFPRHCCHFSSCGKKYLSFDFYRLGKGMNGYGYFRGSESSSLSELAPEDEGLWVYDMEKRDAQLLVSLRHLSECRPSVEMSKAFHFVTHANFSPAEKYISFMHRWTYNNNLMTRLYIFNQETQQCEFFAIRDASHIAWNPDETLTIFGWDANNFACYMKLDPSDMSVTILQFGSLDVDGHPQVNCRGEIITDTYPDRQRQQKLYWISSGRQVIALASYFIPFKFRGEKRCDFHPRWNREGTKICFDSAHSGKRSLCVMDLSGLLVQQSQAAASEQVKL